MEFHHVAELAFFDQPAHGKKVRIPTAILKHADDASRCIGGIDHLLRLRNIQCKRLVHQHMLAGGQGLQREGAWVWFGVAKTTASSAGSASALSRSATTLMPGKSACGCCGLDDTTLCNCRPGVLAISGA